MRNPIDYRPNPNVPNSIDATDFRTGPVELIQEEIDAAIKNAMDRLESAIRRGCRNTHGGTYSQSNHRHGSLGELAFAKLQGVIWPDSLDTFRGEPDVANFEVRCGKQPSDRLIVRRDDLNLPFGSMVMVRYPYLLWCVGWKHKFDVVRHPEWKEDPNDRGPAFFVPQAELNASHRPNAADLKEFTLRELNDAIERK